MATLDSVNVGRIPPITRTPVLDQARRFDGLFGPLSWKRRIGSAELITVRCRLIDGTTRTAIHNSFLAKGSQTSFTFTDDDAVNYTVKYWQDTLRFELQQGGRWNVDIELLRVS